jgi:glyoxylase-like metal-dependent hydrolase (beta-lactamase superfamily II)
MKIYSINTGFFKLDGGAMFGVVPKSVWHKLNPADDKNMCTWAMRCLLIEDAERLILIDNGIGNKQDEKFFGYYYLHGEDSLDKSLARHGFYRNDITDVLLTHLHFDHCGGSIERSPDGNGYRPAFPNALYWSNQEHWEAAANPNPREKASFLKENIKPIEESGQLQFVQKDQVWHSGITFRFVYGHTEAMMLPCIPYGNHEILYMADLIPSTFHLRIPYVMGYDIRPLDSMKEKQEIITESFERDRILFFEHDPKTECISLQSTDGRVDLKERFELKDLS